MWLFCLFFRVLIRLIPSQHQLHLPRQNHVFNLSSCPFFFSLSACQLPSHVLHLASISIPIPFTPATPRRPPSLWRLAYQWSRRENRATLPSSPFILRLWSLFSNNTHAVRRIFPPSPRALHPHHIHPHLPPERMEIRMLSLPQLLLKGTPAPLSLSFPVFSSRSLSGCFPLK